jgi:hypothetical protein
MALWWGLLVIAGAQDDARTETAYSVFLGTKAAHASGMAPAEDVYRWSVRLMEAEEAAGDPTARTKHVVRMRGLAELVKQQVATGTAPALELDRARFYQAEAAAWVADGRPQPAGAPEAPPEPPPPTTPAAPSPDLDACFSGCDDTYETCRTDANHYRLGVGSLDDATDACVTQATQACGDGRSATRVTCREQAIRTCEGERRQGTCDQEQTRCNARCR